MSYQRARGLPALIYRTKEATDARGNKHRVLDEDTAPHEVTAWTFPQRSAKAEVPGQQQINVVRIGTAHDLAGVELWSRVTFMGKSWDVVTPPAYHHGTRHVRHWSIEIRERPSG